MALIQVRRDTAAAWTSANTTLAAGEIGFETDTSKFKIGNGTAWSLLAYALPPATNATIGGIIVGGNLTITGNGVLSANATSNLPWANITGTPATLAGYGITDGLTSANLTPYLTIANANSTYAVLSHTHAIANVTGLQTALNAKLESANFTYANITGTPNLTFTGLITANGGIALNSNLVTSPKIQNYSEVATTPTIASGNLTLNMANGNIFGPVSLNANISNLTITNPPPSGTAGSLTLLLKANGTALTVTWPASVLWPAGTAPTITSTANKTDVFTFITVDGGTSYLGLKAGQNL